jgi:TolB-like protein
MKRILIFLLLGCALLQPAYAQRRKKDPVTDLVNTLVNSSEERSNARQSAKNQSEAERQYNAAMEQLALKLSSDLLAAGKKRVAVVNFLNSRNETTELGKFLAEEFSTLLFAKKLLVVDRSQLETLMNENKIGAKGLLKTSEVAKLGRLAGAQVIVTGTITMLDNHFRLAFKGIDVEQGMIAAAALGTIPRTEALDELYGQESDAKTPCPKATDCESRSLGGVCITNKSKQPIKARIWGDETYLILPGKTEGTNQIQVKGDFKKTRVSITGEGRKNESRSVDVVRCKVASVVVY